MYVDFAVNDTGDLIFEKQNSNYSSLSIKFNISDTKAQKIILNIEESEELPYIDNRLSVTFKIEDKKPSDTAAIYKDDVSTAQLIALKLKTTLGELPLRKEFGSKLSMFKHQNINDKTLRQIENIVESAVSDMIYNPTVVASPIIDTTNGYKQTIKIEIYNNNNLLLQYKVER